MGRSLSLFLMRATGIVLAGMLLFALFGHAHAQDNDNYGLKRFPGDNYDTMPPGAGIAPPPASPGYAPVPGASIGPDGTYSTLNGAPQNTPRPAPQPQSAAADGYQPAPQQRMAPVQPQTPVQAAQGYQPAPQQPMPPVQPAQRAPQSVAQQPPANLPPAAPAYGYRPLPPQQPQMPTEPYGYRPMPGAPASVQAGPQLANAAPFQQAPRAPLDYVFGPGDKLRLTVYGETDLSGEFTIDGSGYVRFPLIGQTAAAGYTARQLEQMVAATLSRGYMKSPRVSIDVTTYRPFYVIGAVNRPGQYPFVEHMSAMNAIALAGGFNPSAVESVIFVRHEGSNKEEQVAADQATQIYPGDVIKVHTTFFADISSWLSPFSGVAASAATAAVLQ